MMHVRAFVFSMVAIVALGMALVAPAVHAAAPVTPATTSAASGIDCKQFPGLANRVAQCFRATIDKATDQYFNGFYKLVSRGIAAFITLGVVIYGVMAASGAIERVGQDTIFLLMKIAFIGALTTNTDYLYKQVVSAMDSAAGAVISYTPGTGIADSANTDMSQITCLSNMRAGPWLGIDCVLDTVIGIKQPDDKATSTAAGAQEYYNKNFDPKQQGLSRGLMYVFFSGIQTSVVGAVFAIIGFIFIYGLVFLILKTLLIYLTAYVGIAFLMIISPLFIPLVLMRVTKEYFDKWVKLVISFALQPIIMLVFVSMTVAAVDLAAFSGEYSLMYRLAGNASKQNGFNLNKYLSQVRTADGTAVDSDKDPRCTGPDGKNQCKSAIISKSKELAQVKANVDNVAKGNCPTGNTLVNGLCESQCTKEKMAADPALKKVCDTTYPLQVWHKAIDWDKLAELRGNEGPAVTLSDGSKTPGEQIARECLSAAIFCGIVVFIMNGLAKIVPTIAYDLLGDYGQSPNFSKAVGSFGKKQIGGGAKSAFGGIQNAIAQQLSGRGK